MGKIHKALEKSKKELQQEPKNPYESLKNRRNNRLKASDTHGYERHRSDDQNISESKLESIHALLDEASVMEKFNEEADSPKDSAPNHKTRSANHERIDEIDYGNKIDSRVIEDEKPVFSTHQTRNSGYSNVERTTSTAISGQRDEISQNTVFLKGTSSGKSDTRYIRTDDHLTHEEQVGSKQPQLRTGQTLKFHYSLVTLAKPNSFETEQFKILRANLLFPKSGKSPKTILVTSAVPGEGKTFTAINLAVSLAQNINSHVLLVDADIRKPDVHKRFGLGDNIKGLSDFLTQNTPISSLLVRTPLSNLTILPGGKATVNPSELISSEKMQALLTELSTRYSDRYVVIDAPPPKLAAETYALARFVEHIIPVVRSGRSNRELVDEMMNLLGRDKIHGIVLNCYDIRKTKRYGYHKYSEYYSK